MEHFSKNENPVWKEINEKSEFAWDHYTGKYIDKDKISNYLFQKMQREGNKAFDARKKDPDPILHFATAVDGINGIVFSKAKDTVREWGDLGDPETEGTIAYGLTRNADGEGTNWAPLFKKVGIKLTVMHTIWGLVEGVQEQDGVITSQSSIKVINPQSVVDWYPMTGNPRQVLVKEKREVRESITEDAELQEVFTLFELDGWKRFTVKEEKQDNGEITVVETVIDEGEYQYWDSSNKKMRILPIFKVQLPLPRHLGYLLAKKQNHIFNYKSIRDHGASNLSLAILKIKADESQYKSIINSLEKGANTIREDAEASGSGHSFMTPDGSHLAEAGKILDTDVQHFYQNAFREFGDAAQVTATEIIQKSSTGIEAFLALLVSSIDEFENQCFLRLLQAEGRPESQWGSAHVERSTDFQPQDIEEAFERMKKRFFGDSPVPVPNKQKAQLVKLLLEREGVTIEDESEIEDNLDRSIDTRLAEAISRIAGEAISTEEMVKVLRPGWDETKVNAEVQRIRMMRGAVPENAVGG